MQVEWMLLKATMNLVGCTSSRHVECIIIWWTPLLCEWRKGRKRKKRERKKKPVWCSICSNQGSLTASPFSVQPQFAVRSSNRDVYLEKGNPYPPWLIKNLASALNNNNEKRLLLLVLSLSFFLSLHQQQVLLQLQLNSTQPAQINSTHLQYSLVYSCAAQTSEGQT